MSVLIALTVIITGLFLYLILRMKVDEDGVDADLGDSRSQSCISDTVCLLPVKACSQADTDLCREECSGISSAPEGVECINPAKNGELVGCQTVSQLNPQSLDVAIRVGGAGYDC